MLKKSLQQCAEIEKVVGQIYRKFADNSSDPALQSLWEEMQQDEKDHERQIRFALRLPEKELFAESASEIDRRVEKACQDIRKILLQLEKEQLDTEKMFKLAEYMEKRFLEVHIANIEDCTNAQLKKMFTALGKHDREHVEQLEKFIADYRQRNSNSGG